MTADFSENGVAGELARIAQGDDMPKVDKTQQTIDLITALAPIALQLLQALEPGMAALGQQFATHIGDLVGHVKPTLTAAS